MAHLYESRTISIDIARNWKEAYDFAAVPENFSRWASGLGKSLWQENGEWRAQGPEGPVRIRFSERNAFGVLDHVVTTSSGAEVYIPLRIIANGTGCLVMLTLFRLPGMTAEKFDADAEWVKRDLNTLKTLLQA
jgi:hypothetical protein